MPLRYRHRVLVHSQHGFQEANFLAAQKNWLNSIEMCPLINSNMGAKNFKSLLKFLTVPSFLYWKVCLRITGIFLMRIKKWDANATYRYRYVEVWCGSYRTGTEHCKKITLHISHPLARFVQVPVPVPNSKSKQSINNSRRRIEVQAPRTDGKKESYVTFANFSPSSECFLHPAMSNLM
jgi:hypothetical protein